MSRDRHTRAATLANHGTAATWRLIVVFVASVTWLPAVAREDVRAASQSPSRLRAIKEVVPVYPPIAQSARVSGMVIIEAAIGPGGRVTEARITRSVPILDQAALDAVRQWEFAALPADAGSSVVATVVVNFALGQNASRARARELPLPAGVPQDFAFAYEYRCADGGFDIDTTSDLLFRSDNPTSIRLELTGDDVAAVYRELASMGFFASRDGLATWPAPALPAVPEGSFEVTVSAEPPVISVINSHVAERKPGYSLRVRSQGWWTQAWPLPVGARPDSYEKQISAVSDLISRTVERTEAWRQLPRERYSCR
jgi:TonB family protein